MASRRLPRHLTDEQFSDLLAGETPSEAVAEHLSGCEHCRGELEAVQGSLSNFNLVSLRWAQQEAAAKVQTPSRWALQAASMPAWAIALTGAAVACIVSVGIGVPFQHEPDQVTAQVVIPVPSDAEIARDNQLMSSIDQELQYEAQLSIPATELVSASTQQQHPQAVSN